MTDGEQRDLLREARERYDAAWDNDQQNRDQALDDLEFAVGEHWPESVRADRENQGRPIITVNQCPQFIRQVTGDIRRTNPAIKIGAADGDADKDVAEVYEGMIRHIEHRSSATGVYEAAAESAATCSMGYFRILADREPGQFHQDIRIDGIPNPFAVYFDTEAKHPTRKDARYCFVVEHMAKERFEEEYPDAKPVNWESDKLPEYMRHWFDGDDVMVAEYFKKVSVKRTMGLLADGRVVDMAEHPMGIAPVEVREIDDVEVHWYKITGDEVLEGPTVLPTRHIPVIAVVGEEVHVGERTVRSSVIRYAKDAQRLYNYFLSAEAEYVALQPKAPYKVTPKQIEGLERFWEAANTDNKPFLPYNPDPNAPGAPQREMPPVASQGMVDMINRAADDMRATTGIYDAALGQRSNENSGVAIQQRQLESDISTSIYVDNLAKAIEQCGRVIVDMIPRIYDTTRMVRVLGEDDAEQIIKVNEPVQNELGETFYINDLSRGRYDVRVSTGPNYSTKRQEAAQAQIEFIRAVPSVAAGVMDLIAKNMDWPGADQFAERLRKMLPPGMDDRDVSEMTPEEQEAYQVEMQQAQQMQQMQQQAAMLEMADKQSVIDERLAKIEKMAAETQETKIDAAINATELAARNGMIDQIAAQQTIATLQALEAPNGARFL